MVSGSIKGFAEVQKNLNKQIKKIEGASMAGLIEGAIIIRRDMDRTPPLIPILTGNLRDSWFTETFYKGKSFGLTMGFTANYAVYVHESVGRSFQRPGSGPKFFQASLFRNQHEVLKAVQRNAQIP